MYDSQCWKFPPVRSRQLWRRTGNLLTFLQFYVMVWDSRHKDLQVFDWVSNIDDSVGIGDGLKDVWTQLRLELTTCCAATTGPRVDISLEIDAKYMYCEWLFWKTPADCWRLLITHPQRPHGKNSKISKIRHNKSQNLNDSRLVLQLSLSNPLKPGVKSKMKM